MLGTDWHYMTLPVWFMNYRHGGKNYNFAINGQTGKVAGIYPVSGGKLAVFMALMAAIVGIFWGGIWVGNGKVFGGASAGCCGCYIVCSRCLWPGAFERQGRLVFR